MTLAEHPGTTEAIEPVEGTGRTARLAQRLPEWLGSIRFRLAALYSVWLFGLAALVVAGIYIGLSHRLSSEPITDRMDVLLALRDPKTGDILRAADGRPVLTERTVRTQFKTVEQQANERALEVLRNYSFGALGLLFWSSLVVGWLVAGRVLRPMGRITAVAREIQATDLSRRINLSGPNDELRQLADTFDGMLGRIDDAFENQRRFIHEASHELRNPIAVIRTNLDVALSDPDASAEDLRYTAELVSRTADRMSHLVDDLLAYARRGITDTRMARVDVAVLTEEVGDEFQAVAEAKGVVLDRSTEPGLWVLGDPHALRQALLNLLTNAVRLAPGGTHVRIAAGRADGWIWLAVEDQGPGIAPELQDKVFQRFYRGDEQQARTDGRSGLGLTIVRQIAEAHRGRVQVASQPGLGSTFSLWLPPAGPEPKAAAS